jgi:Neuraminidase (sialidase)
MQKSHPQKCATESTTTATEKQMTGVIHAATESANQCSEKVPTIARPTVSHVVTESANQGKDPNSARGTVVEYAATRNVLLMGNVLKMPSHVLLIASDSLVVMDSARKVKVP